MAQPRPRWLTTLLAIVLGGVALELAARGLLALAPGLLPPPPPVELGRVLDASDLAALLRPDRDLLFALVADADADLPRPDAFAAGAQPFHVRTNARGFRSAPFSDAKPAGVTRIVALGDSVTFGAYVDDHQAFPQQLAARLEASAPGRYEVINLGVPGYGSRQGLELLRRQVLALQPDIVLFAYGQSDRALRAADTDAARIEAARDRGIGAWLTDLALGKLLERLAGPAATATPAERVQRGTLDDVSAAIVAAHQDVRAAGGRLVVVNTDFSLGDAVTGMRTGVQRSGADFVDAVGALRAVGTQRSVQRLQQLGLPAVATVPRTMTFRVEAPEHAEVWLEIIRGGHSQLIPMSDDGSGADQVAYDSIFTAQVEGQPGLPIAFTYRRGSVLGPVREFTHGPERNRSLRRVMFDPRRGDIDRFAAAPLMAAPDLPDAEGQATIAQVLAAHIAALPSPAAP